MSNSKRSAARTRSASLWPPWLCAALLIGLAPGRLHANDLVQADLLAEPGAIVPGAPFAAAIRLHVPEGWHVSWRNPGDAGLAPTVRWELPAQITAGELQWPVPVERSTGPVTTYALEGEVWLLVELLPARSLALPSAPNSAPSALKLAAQVEWLVCKDLCIPESAHLELLLPVAEKPAPPGLDAPGFLAARARLPRPLGFSARLARQDPQSGTVQLAVETRGLRLPGARVHFFPHQGDAIEPSAPQLFEPRGGGFLLTLRRPKGARGELAGLSGVLVLEGNDARDRVAAELATGLPMRTAPALPLWLAVICAFAGGLLLNLMPCVLPVLGFKVLSLVRDASAGEHRARVGGLAYAAGVVASFWALAAVLLALRASGSGLGWGFQLQSPAVVALLALLFFGIALSFLGFFEGGFFIQSRAGAIRFSASGWGAFGSGVLATAVATPCTAPFMGVALGAALIAPPLYAFAIFTALGVGMAWPYALLSLWPALLARVPKPGPWMQRLQQALAFPLFATVLWLLSVLSAEAGPRRVKAALVAMLLTGFALWLWRGAGGVNATARQRWTGGLAAVALVLLGAWGAVIPNRLNSRAASEEPAQTGNPMVAHSDPDSLEADSDVAWIDWSAERFAQLRAEKRIIYVDFTAAWCLSCQVNERLVFSSPDVLARFAALNVVPMRADWTRADPAITRALESFGRSGVPLNAVAGPGAADPLVLPAVLTPGAVLDSLEQVAAAR